MKHLSILIGLALPASLFILVFPHQAHAYLDPGTGSYVFQMMIAGLVGAAFAIKMYWRRIKAFFVNLSSKRQEGNENDD